jgi:hypothetical protein
MWIWCSKTGALLDARLSLKARGYAGRGDGKNNPDMQHVKGIGPIPEGIYTIEAPHDSSTTGPYTLRLVPRMGNEMYGRSSFAMHGDSKTAPGEASHGCPVVGRTHREAVWESGDHECRVVAI